MKIDDDIIEMKKQVRKNIEDKYVILSNAFPLEIVEMIMNKAFLKEYELIHRNKLHQVHREFFKVASKLPRLIDEVQLEPYNKYCYYCIDLNHIKKLNGISILGKSNMWVIRSNDYAHM